MSKAIVNRMLPLDIEERVAARLALEEDDEQWILGTDNEGRAYLLDIHGNPNAGMAYIDKLFVAIEAGGDPMWFTHDNEDDDDHALIEMALNNQLEMT